MTYEKPRDFSLDAFAEPDSFFWPSYFWVWNDKLETGEIVRQLRDMHEHGVRGVCIVPEPAEFRPQSMATALEPEYLTPPYFEVVRLAVEECERLGMSFWLYDEGGWPSGSACGRVVSARPDLANCRLEPAPLPLAEAERHQVLATAWKDGDSWRCLAGYRAEADGQTGAVAYRVARQQARDSGHPVTPDLLDPEASAIFIGLTHERYARCVGTYMGPGRVVSRAFTDEPAVPPVVPGRQIPWTNGFLQLFRAEKGYDLLPYLPALFADPSALGREEMLVRFDYFDVWSRRFVSAYLEPIRAWCRDHGVLSSGHFGGEDETEGSVRYGFGHILRALRGLDMPGVDAIWRQLWPGQGTHHFPKYASSVARQTGAMAMSESFAVYGNGLTPAEMKWLVDFQWVRGVTNLVGACYPYSTRDHFMFGERPHISSVNPLWDGLVDFHAYVARLSYALSAGQPRVQTAVYFPVRDIWSGLASAAGVTAAFDALAQTLLSCQCDFDFVDDDILQTSPLHDGVITVGPMHYSVLVLSRADWLPAATVEAIGRFIRAGGHLLCCEGMPRCDGAHQLAAMLGLGELRQGQTAQLGKGHVSLVSLEQAAASLRPIVELRPRAPALRACCQESISGQLYFLVNEGGQELSASVLFPEPTSPLVLDPVSGAAWPYRECGLTQQGQAELALHLAPYESLLLWFPSSGPAPEVPQRWAVTRVSALGPELLWRLRPLRRYCMGDHGFVIEELAHDTPALTHLGDWRAPLGEDFSGQAEYSIAFNWLGGMDDEAWLDLGEVRYAAEAWLNGAYLGRRLWPAYRFAATAHLHPGENELRLVVTNTLANALVGPRGERILHCCHGPGWPGPYDARAREFERESLASGLFGPVRLLCGHWVSDRGEDDA